MPEYLQSADIARSVQKENTKAREMQRDARIAEKRVGVFLFQMLEDLRIRLRSGRERRVIMQEEQKLRLRNKWARLVWRDPLW